MARKSKKNIDTSSSYTQKTVMYIRLSEEDNKKRGDSITTQKQIIKDYIKLIPELEIVNTYIDNGNTGRTFTRPAFTKMIENLKNIDCIIVKDLSRLGRNFIETGYYLENLFPLNNIRFISVNDNYDSSLTDTDELSLSLKNLINEAYSIDIGKKVKAQQHQFMLDGKYVGSVPPYGYKKDPKDCHKLLINEETAPITKLIFEKVLNGESLDKICKFLNDMQVSTPSKYNFENGYTTNSKFSKLWQTFSIRRIIDCDIYTGDMVQGKSHSINKVRRNTDKENWIIVPNTHEALVSKEDFKKANEILENKKIPKEKIAKNDKWNENIFKGKIFCAECGKNLHRAKKRCAKLDDYYYFKCISNYRISSDFCSSATYIREEKLIDIIRNIVLNQVNLVNSKEDFFDVQKGEITKNSKKIKDDIKTLNTNIVKNQKYLKNLYESLISATITKEDYLEYKQNYEDKIKADTIIVNNLEESLSTLKTESKILKTAKNTFNSNDLIINKKFIDTFISKIYVHQNEDKSIKLNIEFSYLYPLNEKELEYVK